MSLGALDAASAYGRVMNTVSARAEMPEPAAPAGSASTAGFGSMIEQLVTDASHNLRAAETASVNQVAGKGDLIDVVTAIGAAETALDTVVAVRDRVVNAYTEIMRMQI